MSMNIADDTANYLTFVDADVAYSVASADGEYIFDYDDQGNLVGADILTFGEVDINIPNIEAAGKELSRGKYEKDTMGGPPTGEPPPEL